MSAERTTRFAHLPALIWGAIGSAACAAMIPLEPSLLEEGLMVHVAQRLLEGEHLYRDIESLTGPFPYQLVAILFRLFGEEIAVARVAIVVLQGLACASTYDLARRAGAGPLAHAAAAGFASAPVLLFPSLSIMFYTAVSFYLVVISAYAALRATRSSTWAVTAGVVIACAALCKQTVGALLAASLLAGVAAGAEPGVRIRRVLALAAGSGAVAAIALATYAARGDLGVVIQSLVVRPLFFGAAFGSPFVNFWPPGEFAPVVRMLQFYYLPQVFFLLRGDDPDVGGAMILATQLIYAMPFIALAATALRRALGPMPVAAWLHAGALLALTANLFPRTDWGHVVFALPSSAVQLILLAPRSEGAAVRGRLVGWAASGAVLVFALSALYVGDRLHDLAGPATFGPRVPQRPVSPRQLGPEVPRVIRYLRERVEPGEAIFVARAEPLIYFATDTRNPTPFTGALQVWGIRGQQQDRILAALEDVRFVVMSDIDSIPHTSFRDELPRVQDYLERHFAVPREFTGRNASWLMVLERTRDRGPTAIDLTDPELDSRAWVRDAAGVESPAATPPPRLPTRQNRRPLSFVLGEGGGGIDFELELPERALFQGDVGFRKIIGAKRHPNRVRLAVSIARAGGFERLGSKRVAFRRGRGRSWIPFKVDLSAFGGQSVTLRLELVPEARLEPGRVAWWGSPRIALPPETAPRRPDGRANP